MTTTETLSINDIQARMRARGSHWWDPDTMRMFGTRQCGPVYHGPGGIYFATSEKTYNGGRAYTVRQFYPSSDDIGTVGSLGDYDTAKAARRVAMRLAHESLAAQYLAAYRALDEAVTGRDLGETFDAERNYTSLDGCAMGSICYFSGDGGYTRYQAKPYEDGSGFCLVLIETGSTDRKAAWSKAWDQQKALMRILCTFAGGDYQDQMATNGENLKPITDAAQLLADLQKHGNPDVTAATVRNLMRHAATHHKYMEAQCNAVWPYDPATATDFDPEPKIVTSCRRKIELAAKQAGAVGVLFSGDPRGCTVKLVMPDGYTDDFGKEGLCVPIED